MGENFNGAGINAGALNVSPISSAQTSSCLRCQVVTPGRAMAESDDPTLADFRESRKAVLAVMALATLMALTAAAVIFAERFADRGVNCKSDPALPFIAACDETDGSSAY
jgi:hypothetical protein